MPSSYMKVWDTVSLTCPFSFEYAYMVTSWSISQGYVYWTYVPLFPGLYQISAPDVSQEIVMMLSENANVGTAGGWVIFSSEKLMTFILEYLYGYAFSSNAHPTHTVRYLSSGRSGNR